MVVDAPSSSNRGDLTEKQAAFVLAFTSEAGTVGNGAESARRAGYAPKHVRVQAQQLLALPHVKTAIDAANRAALSGRISTKSIALLERVVDDEAQPMKLRVEAAKTVLDRGGFGPPTASERNADAGERGGGRKLLNELSPEELDARIAAFLAAGHVGPGNAKTIEGTAVGPSDG